MEHECEYVNSRGILQRCTVFKTPTRSSDSAIDETILANVQEGDSVYICTSAITNFMNNILPKLTKRIILVSGDSDTIVSNIEEYMSIIECPYIVKWFVQNCLIRHHKLIHIPIGTYYHVYYTAINNQESWTTSYKTPLEQEAEMKALRTDSVPFWQRICKCYTTFHFQMTRGDRLEAYRSIPSHLIDYEPMPVPRLTSHITQRSYAFVASPYGGGTDCHRTWEALLMGCIPIVKSSGMDPLFANLPVLIVHNWSDITQELLDTTLDTFKNRAFNYDKLTLDYWTNLIQSA